MLTVYIPPTHSNETADCVSSATAIPEDELRRLGSGSFVAFSCAHAECPARYLIPLFPFLSKSCSLVHPRDYY